MRAPRLFNTYTEEYAASGAPVIAPFLQYVATADLREAAKQSGNGDYYPLFAGQGVGLIRDIPAASDVIRSVMLEAEHTLATLAQRVGAVR